MLTVHHGGRAELLVEALIELLSVPPDDPFTPDVVSVPSRGVERWLVQQLARRLGTSPLRGDGVVANIELPFPAQLVARALGVTERSDPWRVGALTWSVLRQCRQSAPDTTYARARQIADLFDRYSVYRPGLLHHWRAGHDSGPDGRALAADQRWQPSLWRALAAQLADDPADRLQTAVTRLRADGDVSDLPARVVMLALGALPAAQLEVLDALGAHRDVHVLALHPSPAWWRSVRQSADTSAPAPILRRPATAAHPLLRTWGQAAYESQLTLLAGAPSARWHPVDDDSSDPSPTTLLERLQHDLRAGTRPAGGPPLVWAPDDRTVQVHACHGRARQVEVLRDAIAHLLADPGAGLEQRDVVVLCPDLDGFRSLLTSTIGLLPGVEGLGAPRFALTIARSGSVDQPMVEAFLAVLRTARGRCTASAIGALAALAPVQRTFGLSDTDMADVSGWIEEANVRWGLDSTQLASDGIPSEAEVTTWEAALDRLLLGTAMTRTDTRIAIGDRRPSGAVRLDDAATIGRLAELVHRVRRAREVLTAARPMSGWLAALRDISASFLTADPAAPWESRRLTQLLDTIESDLAGAPGAADPVIEPDEIEAVLRAADRARGPSANWGSGTITVCGLADLRGVPHQVVCLLGLDDEALQRSIAHPDDLLADEPCAGDRDVRSEQRAMLLDAVLAARRHLVVTYTGHDVRTNQPMPPATPLAELLDVIDQSSVVAGAPENQPTSSRLVTQHPRQSFSERNLRPGELGVTSAWSFDTAAHQGALARRRGGTRALSLRDVRLDAVVDPDEPVLLSDVVTALSAPARWFLDRGLGIRLPRRSEERGDLIVTAPDPLAKWRLAQDLFDLLAGDELFPDDAAQRWARTAAVDGLLPPGRFAPNAEAIARQRVSTVQAGLAAEGLPLRGSGTRSVELTLPDGRRLIGEVGGLDGEVVVVARPARLRAKDRLDAHLRVLALRAAGFAARSVVAGLKQRQGGLDLVAVNLDVDDERALRALGEVVRIAELCRVVALPISPDLAAAWGAGRAAPKGAWDQDMFDESTKLVFGELDVAALADYVAPGTGTSGSELARHLWSALRGVPT